MILLAWVLLAAFVAAFSVRAGSYVANGRSSRAAGLLTLADCITAAWTAANRLDPALGTHLRLFFGWDDRVRQLRRDAEEL